jgi:hypothetical protein
MFPGAVVWIYQLQEKVGGIMWLWIMLLFGGVDGHVTPIDPVTIINEKDNGG